MPLLPSHARGTMTVLRAEASHFSPALGLALSAGGSGLLSRLYDLEPSTPIAEGARVRGPDGSSARWQASPSCALSRDLFHRVHPDEPLRPTANQSLPAAHLSASLTAHILGLASAEGSRSGSAASYGALRGATCSDTGLSVPKLARETGVSIARFERLIEQVAHADAEEEQGPLRRAGTMLMLRLLWLRAGSAGKSELWTFLRTLDEHYGPVLVGEAREAADGSGAGLAKEWVGSSFDAPSLAPAAVLRAGSILYGAGGDEAPSTHEQAEAFEVVAAALAMGGARPPPLLQGRYGFRDQPAVADCAELTARELLNALLWCPSTQSFDDSRLPSTSIPGLREFYAPGGPASRDRPPAQPPTGGADGGDAAVASEGRWYAPPPQYTPASERWFELVSGLGGGVEYLAGVPPVQYEMSPSVDNVVRTLGVLMGRKLGSVSELETLWSELQPERQIELRKSLRGDRLFLSEARGASADTQRSGGGEGGLHLSLELVMSPRLNHAFAIHHGAAPSWQIDVGRLALSRAQRDARGGGGGGGAAAEALALLPALVQPLLQLPPAERLVADAHCDAAAAARLSRVLLLCTSPCDPAAVASCATDALRRRDECAGALATRSEHAAARAIGASEGLSELHDDEAMLRLARAASRAGPLVKEAALAHAPLAAATAVLVGDWAAWARALAASPVRTMRLSVRALVWRLGAGTGWALLQ